MVLLGLAKFVVPTIARSCRYAAVKRCYSVFGIQDLITQDKSDFQLEQVRVDQQELAVDLLKQHYLPEHVLVRARHMDLTDDRAIDEYLVSLLKQGNTIYARADDGRVAGICVGFASSPVDPRNLRNYAFYRQDPNTKDFLYFTAKLQETPNLWETFKQQKIFEIKMMTVVPEFRRLGLATTLVEALKTQAHDQGFSVVRMDCMNPYDYKVAERCMLHCVVRFPLHRLRGPTAPFVKRSSRHNCCVRVYVAARPQPDAPDVKEVREKSRELENLIE
ncbi:uncharacterized protein LOC126372656 [Pectinophora gossypiella]|uniref:uncharacterized protein LOC126372656 n=1 Tax=Pectinophora gossypiella TaxID=13191 RepID=UPI00214E4D70|nr:uncharacterized protein LOC126372656 [Pectinophora gossypiella]